MTLKNPATPPGIDPGTVRLVVQRLNHYATLQSKALRIITDAPRYVPNAVIKHDLKVLSLRKEVHNYRVTYRQRLDDHPKRLAKSLFQRTHYNRRLKRYYPADPATRL
jgi:hypothetical protein